MTPLLELLVTLVTKLFQLVLELNKGNLYQGQRMMYTYDEHGNKKYMFVYIEGESITISGVPLEGVPEAFKEIDE